MDGPHLALREDLELPADPRRPSFTKGQSSYSSGDQFSLGSSKPKLGFVNKSTDMPAHKQTDNITHSQPGLPCNTSFMYHKVHVTVFVPYAYDAPQLTGMLAK